MWNAKLDKARAEIKNAGRNINNLRYTDNITLMSESEELKSLFLKVKEESEKAGLKLNIQKTKIMTSGPITSWQIDGETVIDFIFGGSRITANGDCSHEIKRHLLLGRKAMTNIDNILKRYYFANKVASSQSYGFSSSHLWMWELDYKESWEPKNWSFCIVLLEKTLESPLDCKKIQPINPKGNQSWLFIGRTDIEAKTPILWPPDAKNYLTGKDIDAGKDWKWEEKRMTEDEIVGWHHRLNGHEFEQAPGVGDGQGSLTCCNPWGLKEPGMTMWLKWTELNFPEPQFTWMSYFFVPSPSHRFICWPIYQALYTYCISRHIPLC